MTKINKRYIDCHLTFEASFEFLMWYVVLYCFEKACQEKKKFLVLGTEEKIKLSFNIFIIK